MTERARPRTDRRDPATVGAVVSAALTALLSALVFLLVPGTAAADVTVAASRAESGARDVTITFRVPVNPDLAVPATRLEVFLPTARPLLGVTPTAPTGWTARSPPRPATAGAGLRAGARGRDRGRLGGTVRGADYAVFPIDVDRP